MRAMLTGAAIGVVMGGIAVGVSAGAWPESKRDDPRMATYQQLDLFTEVLARAKADSPEVVTCMASKSSGERKLECGSSELSMPSIADSITSTSSISST